MRPSQWLAVPSEPEEEWEAGFQEPLPCVERSPRYTRLFGTHFRKATVSDEKRAKILEVCFQERSSHCHQCGQFSRRVDSKAWLEIVLLIPPPPSCQRMVDFERQVLTPV